MGASAKRLCGGMPAGLEMPVPPLFVEHSEPETASCLMLVGALAYKQRDHLAILSRYNKFNKF